MERIQPSEGFSIIEIVISAAIIASTIVVVATGMQAYLKLSLENSNRTQAALLTEETGEVLLLLRDQGWDERIAPLLLNTPYYLGWNGTEYVATTSESLVYGKYKRTFELESIDRDGNDNISASGSEDDNTFKATITISVRDSATPLAQSEMLIHNTYAN